MSSLGDRLKQEREKRGWSQVFVAKKLGLKRSSTYANWEYGIREPDLDMLKNIAELYEIYIDDLTKNSSNSSTEKTKKEERIIEEKLKLADTILNLPENEKKLVLDMVQTLKDKKGK